MKGSFRNLVLRTIEKLGPIFKDLWVPREYLLQHLGLAGPGGRKKLSTAISELAKEGRLEREGRHSVRFIESEPGAPEKQAVMWAVFRAKKVLTAHTLAALAQTTAKHAQEWLEGLVRLGLAIPVTGAKRRGETYHYRLVKDAGPEPPRNEANAEKLRRWREKKKEALAALDAAFVAVSEARLAVSELEER